MVVADDSAGQARARVVGRELELAVAVDFLVARPVGPAALVIEGGAGVGKSTIFRASLEVASSVGVRMFLARPSAGEMELPFAGLGDLLSGIRGKSLEALAGPQRAALESALARDGSNVALDEHALSRGLLELLRLEGGGGDLLVAVDDVQWLDRPTVVALSFALRRLGSLPIRVLVAARAADGSPAETPLGLVDWENVQRVTVGPLSTTDLGALIRERLGKQLPRPRLDALRRASGGNPMFALELASRSLAGTTDKLLPTLSLALEERLRALDPRSQMVLAFVAAALRPSPDLLLRAGVPRADLKAALDTGILTVERERLSFPHPLSAAAAYELMLPDERREAHARLAEATKDVIERGHHVSRSASGHDASAVHVLDRAAEEAANLGDHAGAAAFLLRAIELSDDSAGETCRMLEIRAAAELQLAGDAEGAIALSRKLVEQLPAGVLRARARRTLISCAVGSGVSYDDAIAELSLALEDAQADEELQAEIHVDMAEISCGLCLLNEAVIHGRRAKALAERAGANAIAVAALAILGFAESMFGRGVPENARRAFSQWDGTIGMGNSPRMELACVCMHAAEFTEAAKLFTEELAIAQEFGLEPVEVVARGHLAEVQLRAGSWADALENARLALEHGRQAAHPQIIVAASCVAAMAEALLGNHEHARTLATGALCEAEETHDFWWTIGGRAVLGLVALTENEPHMAVDALAPAWALMLGRGLGDLSIFPVAHVLGEALVAVGRLDDALGVAEALRGCPVGDRPWCRAMAGRCVALVASARGDHQGARNAIADALEAHDELPEPFEHARALHLQGRLERRARGWGSARAALIEALERFDALGAARWAEKAAADIATLPGRRPADKHTLTTRENEIAQLVAAGLANKEVAARLFVSLRSVEANLSKVYAKLGVRSRSELARRLSRSGET